jgi:hypothetical protein
MSWTYSADPSSSAKDAVRYLISDTDPNEQNIQDEELYWELSQVGGEIYRAAANACTNLAAIYANQSKNVTKSVGGLSIAVTYSDRSALYESLAKKLMAQSLRYSTPTPSADSNALGAEFGTGFLDAYDASNNQPDINLLVQDPGGQV